MPFGPSDTIRKSLNDLLAARGGFVIFSDENGDFVQFSREAAGLGLYWSDVSRIELPRVAALLRSFSFGEDKSGDIPHLRENFFALAGDGVYAQFGRDAGRVETFTLRAFRELFGKEPQKLDTELELE
jgi:hypothetical protein